MVEAMGWKRYVLAVATVSSIGAAAMMAPSASAQTEGGSSAAPADGGTGSNTAPAAAYSGPPPYVFVRPPRVGQGLSPESVHRAVTRAPNQTAITQCYTQLLATSPRAHALVSVRLEVIAGGIGTIDSVHVSPSNDTLRDCVRTAVGNIEWPNPRGVPSAEVDLQIDLAPTPPPNAGHPHH